MVGVLLCLSHAFERIMHKHLPSVGVHLTNSSANISPITAAHLRPPSLRPTSNCTSNGLKRAVGPKDGGEVSWCTIGNPGPIFCNHVQFQTPQPLSMRAPPATTTPESSRPNNTARFAGNKYQCLPPLHSTCLALPIATVLLDRHGCIPSCTNCRHKVGRRPIDMHAKPRLFTLSQGVELSYSKTRGERCGGRAKIR